MKESFKEQERLYRRGTTLANKGLNLEEIAKELRISKQRAKDILAGSRAYEVLKKLKKERCRLREERDKRIWGLRAEGITLREIAKRMNLSVGTVRHILDKDSSKADKLTQKIIFEEQSRRKKERERARRLRKQGLTYAQIAHRMGKSSSWVRITVGESQKIRMVPPRERQIIAAKARRLKITKGLSNEEVAKKLGYSRSFICKVITQDIAKEKMAWQGSKEDFERKLIKERKMMRRARLERLRKKKKEKEERKKEKEERKRPIGNPIAVGYCRVSTEEQKKEGQSLEMQEEMIKSQAKKKGWDLAAVIKDAGYSGSNMKRPGLAELLLMAEQGEMNFVIVYKLDRLSRNLFDQLKMVYDIFETKDIKVISISEDFDTATAQGRVFMNLIGSFAQYERDLIAERAKHTSDRIWSQGEWKAPAAVPFGYDLNGDGKLVENPEEMKRLAKMFRFIEESEGRLPTDPKYKSYEQIGIECGLSASNVYRLKKIGLKAYKEKYKKYMA